MKVEWDKKLVDHAEKHNLGKMSIVVSAPSNEPDWAGYDFTGPVTKGQLAKINAVMMEIIAGANTLPNIESVEEGPPNG